MTIVTRFAPSPTGLMHLGNARTALFNYLFARQRGGTFIVRSEDTDIERSDERYLDQILADLAWLGIEWPYGPDKGGPHDAYRQSERVGLYESHFERLAASGVTYACFCSASELKLVRKAQLAEGRPPRYPGTCRGLSDEEVRERIDAGQIPSIRFRVDPDQDDIVFDDLVRGEQRFSCRDIGDFVIRRSTGSAAFFFSNALDDALMGVTHVLRGEDHLTNTPRQMLILAALGLRVPRYGHVALLIGKSGAPLSKRAGAMSLGELRRAGYLPLAVTNHLARLGHTYSDNALLAIDELAQAFDLSRLNRAPAHHDPDHLQHWQREALMRLSDEDFWRWLDGAGEPRYAAALADLDAAQRAELAATIRPNVLYPHDAFDWIARLTSGVVEMDADARAAAADAGAAFFEAAIEALEDEPGDFKAFVATLRARTGRGGPQLFMPLRAALTGLTHGPELVRIYNYLGAEAVHERLGAAQGIGVQ